MSGQNCEHHQKYSRELSDPSGLVLLTLFLQLKWVDSLAFLVLFLGDFLCLS